ncbi:FAD-binding oxidoreductase [Tropicimonas sp. IMCC34043]|uniref:FAD-binding oxidoreductase n=1 Tax=Tropicimonas sp. IMCC34043 TaxID=2248760 RepID=UPI000E270A3B|nr:FAD-linked oxidase C-terminal domain-containing protein [Tropicimonas sp. IMCC34043]
MSVNEALAELSNLLGDRISRATAERDHHGQSESYYAPALPDAVAWPETTGEVAALMRICLRQRCPVVGWGTGTSLEGQSLAVAGGVSVDFARMNRLIEINGEDMDCRVQPGITREELNTDLRATGLFFPVDPGANASLGGMAATRASGTTTVRYGSMRENVLGLQVVLADGRVIHTGSRARKSASGYDLTRLFVGSEGTLGLITELTLRLHGVPEAISTAVCAFERIHDAVATVIATIQMGIPVARIEFVDAAAIAAINAYSGADFPLTPHLLVEFHGSEQAAAEDARRFAELAGETGGTGIRQATKTEDRNALWKMRHSAYHAILASRPGARSIVTDMCVPISRLAEAVEQTAADIAASGIPGPIVGHVGDGNFHACLLVKDESPAEMATAKALAHRMAERALALGGTVTGEHGVGIGKRTYMKAEHGEGWQVMGAIKQAFDPAGILNPGKLVPDLAPHAQAAVG